MEDEIENQEPENPKVNNNDENGDKTRNNKQEITRVHEEDDNDESTMLRRGKRKRAKSSRYYNEDTTNTITSNGVIKNEETIGYERSHKGNEEDVEATIMEYIITQYSLKGGVGKIWETSRRSY